MAAVDERDTVGDDTIQEATTNCQLDFTAGERLTHPIGAMASQMPTLVPRARRV